MSINPSKAKERQEERKKQQQRRQVFIFGGIIVLGILIVVGLALVANAPTSAPLADGYVERYADITRSTDDNGYPLLGRTNAKVQVILYSSFSDTESLAFYKDIYPALLERVRKEEISLAFAPIKTASGGNPDGAARTALCAGEQGKFWEAHDTLFYWAELYGNSAFASNRIYAGMGQLGVNTNTFNACFSSGKIIELLGKAQQGISATPTVKVNGAIINPTLEEINASIDGFAPFTRPESTSEATEEATAEMTSEATEESTAESTSEATEEATAEMTSEATEESTATPRPTNTATTRPTLVRPSATATEVPPSATPTDVPASATVRPSATATDVPPTITPVQPTNTATRVRPNATPTDEATAESTPNN